MEDSESRADTAEQKVFLFLVYNHHNSFLNTAQMEMVLSILKGGGDR